MKNRRLAIAALTTGVALVAVMSSCAPQASEPTAADSAGEGNTTSMAAWSADADCGACHETEKSSIENPACTANMHQGSSCMSCHTDAEALANVHDQADGSGKLPKRLKNTEINDDTCFTCHYGSKEKLAEATSETSIVDDNGTAVNPHDLPEIEDHAEIACGDCHEMHKEEPLVENAEKTCFGCHHAKVFECGTCHETS